MRIITTHNDKKKEVGRPMSQTFEKIIMMVITFIVWVGMLQSYYKLVTTNQPTQGLGFVFLTILFGLLARHLIQLFGWKPPEEKPKIPSEQTTITYHTNP